jgi:hypothetical protein
MFNAASPENLNAASPEHLNAASPEHLNAASPEHLNAAFPEHLNAAFPEHLNAASPEHLMQKVVQVYDGIFDCALLKNKLIVAYISEDFRGKSAYETLLWFHGNNMATTFEQTYKLENLVSTIPAITAVVERSFSALKRNKIYLHCTQGQDRLSHLSLLSIEQVLDADLKKASFHDQVTEKLMAVNRRSSISSNQ